MSIIAGIICEYNPFHNGHYYQINTLRREIGADVIICAMSGHFLQRGEPAMLGKDRRTMMALSCGADLVIELPALYATRSAYWFALGGVSLLAAAGVTHLAFGAETDALPDLLSTARRLAFPDTEYRDALHRFLTAGLSYSEAQAKALNHDESQHFVPVLPNDRLALSYLRIICEKELPIKPILIPRIGGAYHDPRLSDDDEPASATAIRASLAQAAARQSASSTTPLTEPSASPSATSSDAYSAVSSTAHSAEPSIARSSPLTASSTEPSVSPLTARQSAPVCASSPIPAPPAPAPIALSLDAVRDLGFARYIPQAALPWLADSPLVFSRDTEPLQLALLRRASIDSLRALPDMTEGLEHRILYAAGKAGSMDEFYYLLKTKRYTLTRLKRMATHLLIDYREAHAADIRAGCPWLRILGANDKGRRHLSAIRKTTPLPIITRYSQIKASIKTNTHASSAWEIELRATAMRGLFAGADFSKGNPEYFVSSIMI